MKLSCNISVRHVTRVEGHGNISIRVRNGALQEARWEVVETPRFFEALLVGKKWENAPIITSRICGICSIGHSLASIRAVENAFGIVPTRQTTELRTLLKHMETLQSHILHLYFLAAPDFLRTGSVIPLIQSHPQVVSRAVRLKHIANHACDVIGGRRLHPTRTVVGGFTLLPEKKELEALRDALQSSIEDLVATAELFEKFDLPAFERETEFVSLAGNGDYPFIGGDLISSDGVRRAEEDYLEMTNEYTVPQSTSKWSRLSREAFAVGALARLNNNFEALRRRAKETAARFGLRPVNHNPYMNNIAQLVESVHVVEDSLGLIENLLERPWVKPLVDVRPKAGRGVAAVEVPRGILYHAYDFTRAGRIRKADCVIPTSQNHGNIQRDLEELVRQSAAGGKSDRDIEFASEMLVRAYDPCISCSVH